LSTNNVCQAVIIGTNTLSIDKVTATVRLNTVQAIFNPKSQEFATLLKLATAKNNQVIYATNGAAACDFYAIENTTILPKETKKIKTGVALEIPKQYFLKMEGRSSFSAKGIVKAGGVIDSDYRGEIHIILHNMTEEPFSIAKGERIAQGIVMNIHHAHFIEVDELSKTARGEGGFGSTGK
jgi:dUTP pyrophosphatase